LECEAAELLLLLSGPAYLLKAAFHVLAFLYIKVYIFFITI
jgi:hypothetical protein